MTLFHRSRYRGSKCNDPGRTILSGTGSLHLYLTDDYMHCASSAFSMSLAQAEACFRSGRVEECTKLLEAGRYV